MTEDEIRELLREMGSEPVPVDSLTRVRLSVDARTQRRTRIWWMKAAMLAAAVCVAVLIQWLRPPAVVLKTAPVAIAVKDAGPPVQSPVHVPAKPPLPARSSAAKLPARPVVNRPSSAANVVIRIETPDPDVVILLIGD